MIKKILLFFGFGADPKSAREEFEMMFRLVSSQKRLDECSKIAYQAIQRGDTIQQGRVHPYEGTLKAECIKADAALTAYRVEELTRKFGDAQYLIAQINGGTGAQLSEVRADAIEMQIAAVVAQNSPTVEIIKTKLAQREQELKVFMGAHGISGHYEALGKSNTLFYAGTFAILESIANVFFLRAAYDPIIALFIALALAGLNVGGNVWLGNRYREGNHTDKHRSTKGKRNFAYAVLLTLGVGSVIAAARFYAQSKVNSELDGGFLIESIVLLAIGVALGILAFTKGYSMDHPFPGFGPLARATEALQLNIQAVAEGHAVFCENLRKSSKTTYEGAKSRIHSAAANLANVLPELEKALQEWKHQRDQIDNAFCQQQKVFKAIMEVNAKQGSTYPQEIDHLPAQPQLDSRLTEVRALTGKSQTINKDVNQLTTEIDVAFNQLQQWWETARAKSLLRWPS
jgi:hypothetical protein